ncbi:MAG: triose-phosphate isomerase [Fervidicoccaceae archaeon]
MEMMNERIFVINYKSYSTSYGEKGIEIAKIAEKVSKDTGVRIILAVPFTEIRAIASSVEIEVIAQHIDPVAEGAATGHVTAEMVKAAGGKGSLINHSEKRMLLSDIEEAISKLRNVGLYSIACASTPRTAAAVSLLLPDMVAVEPPELIGTGISVSRAKPEVITASLELIEKVGGKGIPVLVGAGVSNKEDSMRSVELGASGILVASAIMNAHDPEKKIAELSYGLLKKT